MSIQGEVVAHSELVGGGQTSLHSHAGGGGEAFPVGSVFLSVVDTSPATLLGYGTWSQIAQGKFLVGQDGADPAYDTAEESGGAKTVDLSHTHDIGHTHAEYASNIRTGGNVVVPQQGYSGSSDSQLSSAQSIIPPYCVVYVWKRTA